MACGTMVGLFPSVPLYLGVSLFYLVFHCYLLEYDFNVNCIYHVVFMLRLLTLAFSLCGVDDVSLDDLAIVSPWKLR